MTAQERDLYFYEHLPHRINLLIAFRERYSGRNSMKTLRSEDFRDLFRCAKDIAMLMVRFFCWEVGLEIKRSQQHITPCLPRGSDYGATQADLMLVSNDPRFDHLRLTIIAANRAVAHIEPSAVDHAVTDPVLIDAIDLVYELIKNHIYSPNQISLQDAMNRPNNRM